jgi:hypothetical protein
MHWDAASTIFFSFRWASCGHPLDMNLVVLETETFEEDNNE